MNTVRLTMSQALVKFLDNQYISLDGIEHKFVQGIFGIFGHGNVGGIGEALENLDCDLKFFQGHNEQGMANAAIAYAKQKNRLGIYACTSSIGPGALNMVTAAATATTNRIPVLLLPGDVFASRQPDPALQQLEQPFDYSLTVNDCFKPVSKYWDRIQRPEQLMTACLHALRVLTDPIETGAVTLCLPQDVQTQAYDYPVDFFARRVHKINRFSCDENDLELIVQELNKADKPLIIAGGGVKYSNAYVELNDFINKYQIPVVETHAGKGVLTWSNSNNMGAIGVLGSLAGNKLAKDADLIIAIGTRLSDFTTCSKTVFNNDAKIYSININRYDGYKLNSNFIQSDAKKFLLGLDKLLGVYKTKQEYIEYCSRLKQAWQTELDVNRTKEFNNGVSQMQVLFELNDFVGESDVVVAAAGSLPGDLQRLWQVKNINTYHLEYAFSCMGYEVAGALGVKMAEINNEVYAIVGDGSFLMLHSELLTSLQENIKINIILLDNSGYQCINNLQCSSGSKGFGNQFRYRQHETKQLDGENMPVDFAQYAAGLGVKTFKANTIAEFKQALIAMRKSKVSTLVDIKVDPESMSSGYDSWWRFDVAELSNNKQVNTAREDLVNKIKLAKQY